jgi:NTP pyrophosphatase (non-canonical NTP hydrolase)
MNLNEYQTKSRGTAVYADQKTTDGLTYAVLALCGEVGELQEKALDANPETKDAIMALGGKAGSLANKLKKSLRANLTPDPAVLADELGDVLWYVAAVAHELGYDLDTVAAENLGKLRKRREANGIVG